MGRIIISATKALFRRVRRVFVFTGLATIALLSATLWENMSSKAVADVPVIRVRDFTLTYFRAPEHPAPPVNYLDPYDSFQKDVNGDLIVVARTGRIYSSFAQADYNEYVLKTKKGNPIVVYQETPSRRRRHKSNCHGLTFLDGDYWLLSSQVQKLLIDNDWVTVSQANVSLGDVAVYREADGTIVHTARVVGRNDKGHILVTSKNGFDAALEAVPAAAVVP